MSEQCPNCLSQRIGKNNFGKKTAGVVCASAGAHGGYAAATAGVILDERALDNHCCLDCGYSFSTDPDSRDDIR